MAVTAATTDPDLTGRTVWVVDTLSRVYQRFHAVPEMTSPSGMPVNAVHGFAEDLLGILRKRQPDYLLCALDAPGPTFRHEKHADYKGTRAEMPADLVPQIALVRQLCATMGIPCLEVPGFEADDILATLAARVTARGGSVVLATSDKDARQLLSDRVRLLNLRTDTLMGPAELQAEWGVRPDQVVDWLSLVGDTADNVPGVPLIGPKAATELLSTFGDLDTLLARHGEVKGAKKQESLRTHGDTARAARELIRLHADVPVEIPWDDARAHPPDSARLGEFFESLGFRRLLASLRAQTPREQRPAPRAGSAALRRDRQGELFAADGDAGDDAVAAEIPGGDAALAALVPRLRRGGDLALAAALPLGAGRMAAPLGLAVAVAGAAGVVAWIDGPLLAGTGPGRGALADLLADPAVAKQAHDAKRLTVALDAVGLRLAGVRFDTMLAGYLLHAGRRDFPLEWLARVSAGVEEPGAEPDAEAGVAAGAEQPTTAEAALAACRAVRTLAPRLAARLDEAEVRRLHDDVELPLAAVLAAMELHGVRIGTAALDKLSQRYTATLADLERQIHAAAGRSFAIASPLQVRAVLFDELHLPVVKRTKTGASTDAEVLEELAPLHPLPRLLLEHRRFAKLKSTYVDALPHLVDPATGCVHTSFNQTIAATGRLSSSDPNLQNIPVRTVEGQQIRAAFLPRVPGRRFVAADYSQIELRILAHLSADAAMREAFASGDDIHARTAAAVFGVAPGAVTAEQRRAAKAVNFGILYGQSPFGLAKSLGISQADAATFIAAYFCTFAGAATFIDDVLDRCRAEGRVATILGRHRAIAGVRERSRRRTASGAPSLTLPERTAVNTVVQGSAADLIKVAMLRVVRRLETERLEARLVLQIHDELLVETPGAEVAGVSALLAEEMRGAMTLSVPLAVSVHSGSTWAECEKG